MYWLKLYTEARIDAKLRTLSDRHFRIWFNLLCLAAEQPTPGIISGYNLTLLAVETCSGECSELETTLNSLQSLRVITVTNGAFQGDLEVTFLNFVKRQAKPPSQSRERVLERVHKCREKKRKEKAGQRKTERADLSVASVARSETSCSGQEKNREEKNREERPPTPSISLESEEPFVPPGEPSRPDPPIPPELKRVAHLAERLFPTKDYGSKILQVAEGWRMDWLEDALRAAHAAENNDWHYILGIYKNIVARGGSSKPTGNPAPTPAPQYPQHVAPADSKFARFDPSLKPKQGA